MKAKTIKQVIRKKVDDWLASVEDGGLRERLKEGTIVTGGCIASMLLREPVNDFDVYFRTYELARDVARYYAARFEPKARNGIPCKIFVWCASPAAKAFHALPGEEPVVEGFGDGFVDREKALKRLGYDAAKPFPGRVKIVVKSAGIASEDGPEKNYEYFESRPEGEGGDYVAEVMEGVAATPEEAADVAEEIESLVRATPDEAGKPPYRPIFLSSNAITLSGKVQLIVRFFGEPDAIHENYDFAHCTNYWKSWGNHTQVGLGGDRTSTQGELVLRPEALECLLTKELRYVGSKYPICSLIRIRKFVARGWQVNAGQVLKAVFQISDLDLKDFAVLEDQLTGVDMAYFAELIARVHNNDPTTVNSAYVVEIIDRMF